MTRSASQKEGHEQELLVMIINQNRDCFSCLKALGSFQVSTVIDMTSLKGVLSIFALQAQVLNFDSFQNGLISVSIRSFAFKDRIIAYQSIWRCPQNTSFGQPYSSLNRYYASQCSESFYCHFFIVNTPCNGMESTQIVFSKQTLCKDLSNSFGLQYCSKIACSQPTFAS